MQTCNILGGGEPGDFAVVRHVRLSGTQREIGADLAELAWSNHEIRPSPSADPSLTRARRKWREANWSQLDERAKGVADRWGLQPDDDTREVGTLPLGFARGSCSVVNLPPARNPTGAALFTRNFDFPVWTMNEFLGASPGPDDEPFCGRPYLLETYPNDGHATLTITAFDLLAAAVDGINDAGLVAALNSDDASTTGGPAGGGTDPTYGPAVGLSEVEFCRFVLERCADVNEALEAVRVARHYYSFHPQHFTVADSSGRSFVYEFSPGRNTEHVTWHDDLQVVTNHLVYERPTVADLPDGDGPGLTYTRFRTLTSLFSDQASYTPEEIINRHATLRFLGPEVPVRTLWYVLYDTGARALTVSFHIRDEGAGELRTPLQRFALR